MYLFTRSRQVKPVRYMDAVGWAGEVTASVRDVTGREVDAWAAVLSPQLGTLVWAMWAETLADVIEAGDKLAGSSAYNESVNRGDDNFDGPVVDGLASLVHGELDPSATPPEYVAVANAVAAPGHLSDAIGFGIEIADHVAKATGQTTLFTVNSTGAYGGVSWITLSADIAAVDAGETALMADPGWLKLIDRVGPAYTTDASQSIFRRIA